jgi:hypothetical protein
LAIPQRIAEDRLVRPRRARSDDHAVEPVLGDLLLDAVLAVIGAGVGIMLGDDHVGQFARMLDHCLDVHHRGDVAAAVADKHTQPRRFVGDVALRRVNLGLHAGAAGALKQGHGPPGGRAGLHDRVGDVLGLGERPADEDARPGGVQRLQLPGLGESPAIQYHAKPLGLLAQRRAGLQTQRQHDHVELFFDLP